MYKVAILFAFAVAGAACQELGNPPRGYEAAPEPYSYAYETDSHAAAEQRGPDGKVSGFYTLVDADGRQRRVEYIADEAGFRAKVQTNEVGTQSSNSADVEVLAAPPTPEQYAAQPVQAAPGSVVGVNGQLQRGVTTTQTINGVQYAQQPNAYRYGYNSQYGYNYPGYGQYNAQYGVLYGANYPNARYGYASRYGTQYGPNGLGVGNYNNHLPSSYYSSVQNGQIVPAGVSYQGQRTVTNVGVPAVSGVYQGRGVQVAGYPTGYSSYGANAQSVTGGYTTSAVGSPNYISLKKRETEK